MTDFATAPVAWLLLADSTAAIRGVGVFTAGILPLDDADGSALWLSAQVAMCCVAVTALPGVALGWLLARVRFPGRVWVQTSVQLPLVMPPVLTGYLLLMVLGTRGWVGGWLYDTLGVRVAFTWWAAVIASSVVSLPLMVRSVRLAIEAVDDRLEQAARSCGASAIDAFLTVTLPLAWPGIVLGMMLAFVRSLGEFGATMMFAGSIEGETRTLPLAMYRAMQTPGGDASAMRLAVIAAVLSIVAVLVSEWLNQRGAARKGRVAAPTAETTTRQAIRRDREGREAPSHARS